MSKSNVFFLLTRVQHLQRYAKNTQITVKCCPNEGFSVEMTTYYPYTDKSVFTFKESATNKENEDAYEQLLNEYARNE